VYTYLWTDGVGKNKRDTEVTIVNYEKETSGFE
jgi:hypothetical protein